MLDNLTNATVAVVRGVTAVLDRDARRLRRVERDPRIAAPADLELLVRAHGVREDKVWSVADRIEAAALEPAVVWTWTMRFDGSELADLCGSRLSDAEVWDHLVAGTLPSDDAAEVADVADVA